MGYWVPVDATASDDTFIYILEHPSREEARKNWDALKSGTFAKPEITSAPPNATSARVGAPWIRGGSSFGCTRREKKNWPAVATSDVPAINAAAAITLGQIRRTMGRSATCATAVPELTRMNVLQLSLAS